MSDQKSALQKHLNDMLGVEDHILKAIGRQRENEDVRNTVEANKVIIEIERVLKEHTAALENLVKGYGGKSVLKDAVSEALGFVAGLYDKVREHTVSRMLRDDYTALSLAAMAYTALHTTGLAFKDRGVADLAERHLKDITPLLVEISKVLPHVVAKEVAEENDFAVDGSVGVQATVNTQAAWSPGVVNPH